MPNVFCLKHSYVLGVLWLLLSIGLFKSCNRTPPEYEAFFTQDWDTQRQQAKTFPIAKQIDYCLAGTRYVHPPNYIVFYVIADRGKEAVPPIIERMKRAADDSDKLELLDLVLNIHEFHDDLSNDKQMIDQLVAIVADMTDPDQKVKADAMLTDIKRPPERTNN
jgi:transcription elongation factor GreA-like protein